MSSPSMAAPDAVADKNLTSPVVRFRVMLDLAVYLCARLSLGRPAELDMYSSRPHEQALVEGLHDFLDVYSHARARAAPITGDDVRAARDSVHQPIVADARGGGAGTFDRNELIE